MNEISIPDETLVWCKSVLSDTGEQVTETKALRVEASHRSFYRIVTSKRSLVLMASPPNLEQNAQFLALAQVFRKQGLPVPEVLAQENEFGWFLLTDLGTTHLEDLYGSTAQDAAIKAAVDVLPKLAAITDPAVAPYTADRLHMELGIFAEWFVEGLLERPLLERSGQPTEFQAMSELLVDTAELQPKGCVHRDFHCRNLMYDNGQLGIVDFQDALHGPILYDIASLLRDCYFEFSETDIDRWLKYSISITPVLAKYPPTQLKLWFDWIAIQRQIKAVGIFARLHLRDQKSSHLPHILPVLHRLQRLTHSYPQLHPLNMQLTDCITIGKPILRALTDPASPVQASPSKASP